MTQQPSLTQIFKGPGCPGSKTYAHAASQEVKWKRRQQAVVMKSRMWRLAPTKPAMSEQPTVSTSISRGLNGDCKGTFLKILMYLQVTRGIGLCWVESRIQKPSGGYNCGVVDAVGRGWDGANVHGLGQRGSRDFAISSAWCSWSDRFLSYASAANIVVRLRGRMNLHVP